MYQIQLITSFSPYVTTPLYTEQTQDTLPVNNAHFTTEINEGGSLELTLPYGHPYYDLLEPLVSYISLLDDDGEILYGRVFDRSDPTLTGLITYQVEGALSFLQDSEVEPESKDAEGNYNTRTLTAEAFFRWCIEQHNADTADPRRHFTVGVVTASRKNETDEYQITSYTETKSAIQQYILDRYGGMLRVRKGEGAIHYIDWVQDYGVVNSQPIELGTNVQDQTNAISADGLFTVLRPVGANGLMLTPKTINVFPQEQINRIGRIVKTETFQDADTEEKLLAKANAYIARIEKKLDKETHVKLIDFHFLNGNYRKIRMGDMYTNIYGFEDDTMTVYTVDQDILHIENGEYTLKNRKELGTITDGRVKGGSISKSSARGARAGGLALKYYHEAVDEATLEVAKLHVIAEDMDVKVTNLDIDVKETAEIAAQTYILSTENYESISHVQNTLDAWEDDVGEIAGINRRLRTVEGSGVIQNSDHITNVSGKFEIWEVDGRETVHLVDGADIAVDGTNGTLITAAALNAQARSSADAIARHETEIDGQKAIVSEMTGSALWTQKEHITGVCGEFDVYEIPDPEHPGHFLKKMKIINGGGVYIERNGTEFGIYDEGTLTGGIIVNKINGQVATQIKGDLIKIGELNNKDLDTWASEAKAGTGVFAKFLTVKRLTAQEISTLLANIGLADISLLDVGSVYADYIETSSNGGTIHSPTYTGGNMGLTGAIEVAGGIYSEESIDCEEGFYDVYNGTYRRHQVVDVQPSGNVLTITYYNGSTKTFSKATSLSGEWSGNGTLTVKAKQNNEVVETWITHLTQQLYQDSNDNKWKYNIQVYGTGTPPVYTDTGRVIDATRVYNYGWADAVTKNSIPTTQWTGTSRTFSWPSDTVGQQQSRVYYLGNDGNNATILYTTVDGSNVTVARHPHDKYNSGWAAARASTGDFPVTTPSTIPNTIIVKRPSSTVDGIAADYHYSVSADNDYAYITYYGTVVARVSHSVYSNGWGAAVAKNTIPTTQNDGNSRTFYWPSDTVGSAQNRTYTLANDGDNAVKLYTTVDGSNVTICKITHNKYNSGWGAAVAKNSIPTSSYTGTSRTFSWPSDTVGQQQSRTYYLANDGDNAVKLYTTVDGSNVTVAKHTHDKYNSGWGAAVAKNSIPTSSYTGTSRTFSWPSDTVGQQQSRTYYLANDGDNAVKLYTTVNGSNVTVAKHTHDKYNSGWGAAVAQNTIPTTQNDGNSRTFYWPSGTVGSAQNRTYSLANDGDNTVKLYTTVNGSNVTICKIAHNKYTAGVNSVSVSTIDGSTYDSNGPGTIFYVTGTASNGANKTGSFYLTADNSYAYVRKGGWDGTVIGRVANPNASSEVTISSIVGDTYDENGPGTMFKVIATASNGASDTRYFYLTKAGDYVYVKKGSWTGDNIARISCGYATPSFTITSSPSASSSSSGTSMGSVSANKGQWVSFSIKATANGKNATFTGSFLIT